jgi:hypothetical protein
MVDRTAVGLSGLDHYHLYELQNRVVAFNKFAWFIWIEAATFGDFAPFTLQLCTILADPEIW